MSTEHKPRAEAVRHLDEDEVEHTASGSECGLAEGAEVGVVYDMDPFGEPAEPGALHDVDTAEACCERQALAIDGRGQSDRRRDDLPAGQLLCVHHVLEESPSEKARFLPDIKAGKCQVAFAHTEPEAGSDAAAIKTAAIRVPGGFRLNGEKIFTTGAASADYIFVVARNEAIEIKGRQVSVFMVKRNAEGLTIERLQKMSANLHASCRVVIQDVYLPEDMVLGGLEGMDGAGSGLRVLGTLERFVVAASNVGLARAATDRAIEFAKARHQFGKPIAAFQSIQHKLVEMRTLVRSMSLMVAHASDLLESGADATEQVCMAKYYCAEQLQHVVACGMRVLGGRAYFEPEDMERYYREAPLALYAGGTVEIQKHLIARCMGLPAV